MKKITGSDIIVLIKAAEKDEAVLREARSLRKDDFDTNDILVDYFFQSYPNGFSSSNFDIAKKDVTAAVIGNMNIIKKEISSYGLRKAHNLLQNVRCSSNSAVILENEVNETGQEVGVFSQIKAAQLVSFLSKYVDGVQNKEVLSNALKNIHSGDLKKASTEIREVFSSMYPDKLVKTAERTLRNLFGENYQLCAKGIYVSGNAVPMPISNCVDYCVDVKINRDGSVGCNYLKWLNENLIVQSQALHFPDKLHDKIHDEQETMNLQLGDRTKFLASDQDSQDKRMIRDEDLTKEVTSKPWEEQLSKFHDSKKEPVNKSRAIASDAALELLLKDYREIFDDDDLDTLEAQIREAVGETE